MNRNALRHCLLPLLCFAVPATLLHAQLDWKRLTPLEGGKAVNLVRSPSSGALFAGSENSGVFRSSNDGAQWTLCNNSPQSLRDIAIAPDGAVYAANASAVYRSGNDGASWSACATLTRIHSLICDRNGYVVAGTDSGIYRSTSAGTAWTRVAPLMTSVRGLALGRNNHLFAANDSGVYRSFDAGQSWARSVTGIASASGSILCVDTVDGDLFLGNTVSDIYRSQDEGSTWVALTSPHSPTSTSPVTALFRHPQSRVLYVATRSLWQSVTIGASWQDAGAAFPIKFVTRMIASGASGVLLGAAGGIFYSSNGGSPWQCRNTDFIAMPATCLLADGNAIYAGTSTNGIFRSADKGASWTPVSNGIAFPSITALEYHAPSNTLLAGTSDRMYRSTNAGVDWTPCDSGLGFAIGNYRSSLVTQIAVHPSGSIFANEWFHGVYRSNDAGRSWTLVNNGLADTLVAILAVSSGGNSAGTVFMGSSSGKMFHSSNQGASWMRDTAGLQQNGTITAIVASAKTGSVFAVISGSLFRSVDAGLTWNKLLFKSGLNRLVIHQASGQIFIAATYNVSAMHVFHSGDDGLSWEDLSQDMQQPVLPNYSNLRLMIDANGFLYAGWTSGGLLFRTQQIVPVTFTAFNAALAEGHALLNWSTSSEAGNYGFIIEKHGEREAWKRIGFVPGTGNSSAVFEYRFTDPEAATARATYRLRQTDVDGSFHYSAEVTVDTPAPQPAAFALLGVSPSPAQGETELHFSMMETGVISISVYDLFGRRQLQLLDEVRKAGTQMLRFTVSALRPGFFCISATSNATRRLLPFLVRY